MRKEFGNFKFLLKVLGFVSLAIGLYVLGNYPRRDMLKEVISIITIVSFVLMISQFFLSRGYRIITEKYKMSTVVKAHKYIGYTVILVLMTHPFLIVLPRYFEGGVNPIEAFLTIITTFSSVGVILGIIAWVLMVFLGITTFYREKIFNNYTSWRLFHGILTIIFISIACWHMLNLGRHSNLPMTVYIIVLTTFGEIILLNTYIIKKTR